MRRARLTTGQGVAPKPKEAIRTVKAPDGTWTAYTDAGRQVMGHRTAAEAVKALKKRTHR